MFIWLIMVIDGEKKRFIGIIKYNPVENKTAESGLTDLILSDSRK